MTTRAALIHCPAGGSASDEGHARAVELLAAHFDLKVYACEGEADPAALAREALADGAQVVISAGGDGTTSAVASALVEAEGTAVLGIVPAGTANSIAGHLGIPKDVDGACAVIVAGHARVVDTSIANGRTMVLLAAIGLHARAIVEADPDRKRRFGALAYVVEGLTQALAMTPFEVALEIDGETHTTKVCAVTIANMAPRTTLLAQGPEKIVDDDGYLDVTLVHFEGLAAGIGTALHLAGRAIRAEAADHANVSHFQAREIRVTPREPQALMIDGEHSGEGPLHVVCRPRSLQVLVPAGA